MTSGTNTRNVSVVAQVKQEKGGARRRKVQYPPDERRMPDILRGKVRLIGTRSVVMMNKTARVEKKKDRCSMKGNAAVISRKKDQQKPYPSFFSQLFQFPAFYSRIIRMVNRSFPPVLLTLYANVFNISLTGKTINHYFTDILFLHRLCRFDFPQLPEDAKSRRRSNDGIFPLYRVIRIQDVL